MHINLFTPVNQLGYGVVGKNLAVELDKLAKVCLIPDNLNVTGLEEDEIEPVKQMFARLLKIEFNAPAICLGYGNMMYRFCGKPRIGYTIFENTNIYEDWTHQLRQLDAVWTFSKWGAEILADNKINAAIVPAGVNLSVFRWMQELELAIRA